MRPESIEVNIVCRFNEGHTGHIYAACYHQLCWRALMLFIDLRILDTLRQRAEVRLLEMERMMRERRTEAYMDTVLGIFSRAGDKKKQFRHLLTRLKGLIFRLVNYQQRFVNPFAGSGTAELEYFQKELNGDLLPKLGIAPVEQPVIDQIVMNARAWWTLVHSHQTDRIEITGIDGTVYKRLYDGFIFRDT